MATNWTMKNMKQLGLLFLLCTVLSSAQTALTLASTSTVYPGSVMSFTVALSGSAGQNISGLGFTLPANSTGAALGTASTAAGKTLWSATAPNLTQLLIGITNATPAVLTNTAYGDGAVLTFSYTVPATATVGSLLSLSLSAPAAASSAGLNVPVTSPTFTATVGYQSTCLTAITGNVAGYLATPTITLLDKILTELVAANGTGTCQ